MALLPALWHVGALARIFGSRLTYPMDLELMEGGQLYHAYRLLHHEPLYGPPEQGFVPYIYPPLHPTLLGGFGAIFGLDYWQGRLFSILCLVVVCAVLYRQVQRHVGSTVAAHVMAGLGVGLVLAAFPLTAGWYDLIRVDALAMAVPLCAAALLVDLERLAQRRRWILLAVMLVACLFAKQTNLFFVAWMLAFLFLRNRPLALRVAGLAAGLTVVLVGIAQLATDGWFITWVSGASQHALQPERLRTAADTLLRYAPYAVLILPAAAFLFVRGWLSQRSQLWLGMLVAGVPAGLLPLIKQDGGINNYMPIVFLVGPVSLLVATDLLRWLDRESRRNAYRVVQAAAIAVPALLLVAKQYSIDPYVPTSEQREAADEYNELVASLDGEVLMPLHPYVAVRNDRDESSQLHVVGHNDAAGTGIPRTDLQDFIARSCSDWVLGDAVGAPMVQEAGYAPAEEPTPPHISMVTGLRVGPDLLFHRTAARDCVD